MADTDVGDTAGWKPALRNGTNTTEPFNGDGVAVCP